MAVTLTQPELEALIGRLTRGEINGEQFRQALLTGGFTPENADRITGMAVQGASAGVGAGTPALQGSTSQPYYIDPRAEAEQRHEGYLVAGNLAVADLDRLNNQFMTGQMTVDDLYKALRDGGWSEQNALTRVQDTVERRNAAPTQVPPTPAPAPTPGITPTLQPPAPTPANRFLEPLPQPAPTPGITPTLGPPAPDMANPYWELAPHWGLAPPPPPTPAPTGAPRPGAVAPLPVPGPIPTEDVYSNQPLGDVYRRVGTELFGPSTSLQRRVLSGLVNRFQNLSPITQFGVQDFNPADTVADQFRRFAKGSRPGGIDLGNQLARIFATASPTELEGSFGPQGEETAENAGTFGRVVEPGLGIGMTPFLQRLSPFVRSGIARELEEEFRNIYAQNPQRFTNTADVFRELQRRRYLPTYSGANFGGRAITPEAAGIFGGNLFPR